MGSGPEANALNIHPRCHISTVHFFLLLELASYGLNVQKFNQSPSEKYLDCFQFGVLSVNPINNHVQVFEGTCFLFFCHKCLGVQLRAI